MRQRGEELYGSDVADAAEAAVRAGSITGGHLLTVAPASGRRQGNRKSEPAALSGKVRRASQGRGGVSNRAGGPNFSKLCTTSLQAKPSCVTFASPTEGHFSRWAAAARTGTVIANELFVSKSKALAGTTCRPLGRTASALSMSLNFSVSRSPSKGEDRPSAVHCGVSVALWGTNAAAQEWPPPRSRHSRNECNLSRRDCHDRSLHEHGA